MPTNANTFNSRVTSEALETKFRQVFPAQGGAELVQDLFASGVIQPVVDFSQVAEGSVLPTNLQTAWDFSTGYNQVNNATTTVINNTGFWKVDLTATFSQNVAGVLADLRISDGLGFKTVYHTNSLPAPGNADTVTVESNSFVVFLRSGDSLVARTNGASIVLNVWYRQIADVNGNLVNPLGFTF